MRKLSIYTKSIICLLIAAALATVFYVLAAHKNAKKELDLMMEYGSVPLFSFNADTISTLEIETPEEGSYTLHYESKSWSIDDVNFAPNEAGIESIVSIMSSLYSVRTISFDASDDDLAMYGLDKPTRLTCKLADTTTHTLFIGDMTPTGENYYAMREGENYIYLISADEGSYLDAGRDLLKDPYIIEYGVIYSDVNYMKLERDNDVVFEIENCDKWKDYKWQSYFSTTTADNWTAFSPIDWPVNYANVTTIIDNIIRVQVYEFVEENCADLEKYGLDNPKYHFSIGTKGGETINISFGNKNIDGTYIYAMYDDTKQVVLFSMGDMAFLECTPDEIYNQYIYIGHSLITNDNRTDIARIELLLDGQKHVITNDSYDDINDYTFNEYDFYENNQEDILGTELVEDLYAAMASLTYTEVDISNTSVQKSGDPYLSIYYLCANEDEVLIELYPVPDEEFKYYIFLNGEYVNLITRESVIDGSTGIRFACDAILRHIEENY